MTCSTLCSCDSRWLLLLNDIVVSNIKWSGTGDFHSDSHARWMKDHSMSLERYHSRLPDKTFLVFRWQRNLHPTLTPMDRRNMRLFKQSKALLFMRKGLMMISFAKVEQLIDHQGCLRWQLTEGLMWQSSMWSVTSARTDPLGRCSFSRSIDKRRLVSGHRIFEACGTLLRYHQYP